MIDFSATFQSGLEYSTFLQRHGSATDQRRWSEALDGVQLEPQQRELLENFSRQLNLLCLAGTWCGDCVDQCPILYRCAQASSRIDLRFVDRDADAQLARALRVLGSPRVPQVVFLSEDQEFVAHFGDRTLARYRQMAAQSSGAACSSGIALDGDPVRREIVQQWIDQLERVQLMLVTSPKLRQRYGD